MYRCELCDGVIGPGVEAERVVVETRRVVFAYRPHVNRFRRGGREKWSDDPGGEGEQIVREVVACPRCAEGG